LLLALWFRCSPTACIRHRPRKQTYGRISAPWKAIFSNQANELVADLAPNADEPFLIPSGASRADVFGMKTPSQLLAIFVIANVAIAFSQSTMEPLPGGGRGPLHMVGNPRTPTTQSNFPTCGPPTYTCSRTDSAVVQVPPPPNVGNLTGANTMVIDPDFGNPIVRVTDWNTDPSQPSANRSYISATSGSADENLWNTNSTMFLLQNLGAYSYPFTFDPVTMQAQRMYTAADSKRGGLAIPEDGMWSRVSPNLLYTVSDPTPVINTYDFSDPNTPPAPQLFYNFSSGPNCLPPGFQATWKSKGGVSADDTTFAMAYSNAGGQGTGIYAVAYRVGSGCTVLNTQTGQVWDDWGAVGTIDIPDRWTIHNVKISKDGNWLIIARANCDSGSHCTVEPYFWQIGTTNVTSCGDELNGGQRCSGHWTEGYTHWINNYDAGKFASRPFADPTAIFYVIADPPAGVKDPLDQHGSWNNADPADTYPFFLTFWSLTNPFPGPWYNEITAVDPTGSGTVWRFAHSFITATSQIFSTKYGIGSVSQDGRFFIFSSDWMGTLGSQSGTATCTIGKDCRGDVFIVQAN
jgi:hypothetical protein